MTDHSITPADQADQTENNAPVNETPQTASAPADSVETAETEAVEEKKAPEVFFEDLDLSDDVLDALYDMRFEKCTPVQAACIPHILERRDVLVWRKPVQAKRLPISCRCSRCSDAIRILPTP